ncbi:MAG TPA: flavin reductase family protein [Holophagaceae bacterium]|nr:flavin reductase family protein [Holophagaceae bacterium]HJW31809.1 flavin reductase family protein [Holophagaceae bacterium]
MITRDFQGAAKRDIYRILSSLVIPRPIAWVSTLDAEGRVNLAPFSSFMGIFGPPMLALSLSRRRGGELKDTHRNLRERGEAVVHLADLPLLDALHASAEEVEPGVSELGRLGLATAPSDRVGPPRLVDAPVALECRLHQEVELGPGTTLVLLDVLRAHAAERIYDEALDCADAAKWTPVARLGAVAGPNYGALGETRRLEASKLP